MGQILPNLHQQMFPIGLGLANIKPPSTLGMINQSPADNLRQRIKHILKDKANFINSNQDSAKRLLFDPLKFMV
jgi:hypothetical protein